MTKQTTTQTQPSPEVVTESLKRTHYFRMSHGIRLYNDRWDACASCRNTDPGNPELWILNDGFRMTFKARTAARAIRFVRLYYKREHGIKGLRVLN